MSVDVHTIEIHQTDLPEHNARCNSLLGNGTCKKTEAICELVRHAVFDVIDSTCPKDPEFEK